MLQKETVETGTLVLIERLSEDKNLSDFYLVGGTALSLQVGHRKSIDVDLFSQNAFDSSTLAKHLSENYKAEEIKVVKNGVFCSIEGVKVDILTHQYAWLNPPVVEYPVRMASLDDIAAMKLHAIVQNGTRHKDFIDIYVLLEHRTLQQMTTAFEQKYKAMNAAVAKNALLYHRDIKNFTGIDFLNRPVHHWYHIVDRLEDAVYNPGKTYSKDLDWGLTDNISDILEEQRERYYKRIQNNRGVEFGYGYGYAR